MIFGATKYDCGLTARRDTVTPLPSLSNLLFHFDAADSSTVTHAGGLISQWDDKSGNGHDITSTGSKRPSYITAARNGLNGVRFADVHNLTFPDPVHNSLSDYTFFFAIDYDATGNGVFLDTETGRLLLGFATVGAYFSGAWRGTSITDRGAVQVNFKLTPGSGAVRVAEATVDSGLPYTQARISDRTILGQNYLETSGGFDGDIYEVVGYTDAKSVADRQTIEAYLATKWDL